MGGKVKRLSSELRIDRTNHPFSATTSYAWWPEQTEQATRARARQKETEVGPLREKRSQPVPGLRSEPSNAGRPGRCASPVQRNTLISPVMFGEISLAPAGMSARLVLPPGQRIQICVGAVGVPMTKFALSCDQ